MQQTAFQSIFYKLILEYVTPLSEGRIRGTTPRYLNNKRWNSIFRYDLIKILLCHSAYICTGLCLLLRIFLNRGRNEAVLEILSSSALGNCTSIMHGRFLGSMKLLNIFSCYISPVVCIH